MNETAERTPAACFNRHKKRTRMIRLARRWILYVLPLALTVYGIAYYCLRIKHDTGIDQSVIETSAGPVADFLFAPAIRVERAWDQATCEDAEDILKLAQRQARAQNKRVLLVFGTTSCLPCHQLEEFFSEVSPILSEHFVVAKINYDVMQHGDEVHFRYRPDDGPEGGPKGRHIPWMAILDDDGNVLKTSDGPDGTIGLPQGSNRDRKYFFQMIRTASPDLTKQEIDEMEQAAKALHERIWAKPH